MLKLAFTLSWVIVGVLAAPASIDPALKRTLQTKGSANIFISFNVGTASVLNSITHTNFENRLDRLESLSLALKEHAASTQKNVLEYLSTVDSVTVTSFWINNQIFVRGADMTLVENLSLFPEVLELVEEEYFEIDMPVESQESSGPAPFAEWGVDIIEATKAWELEGNTGNGVIVATIDTGVRVTHQDLKDNFLGAKGWFDPYLGTEEPNDQNGHGTHTTGTISGQNGIGVAPGTLWMACKGCATSSCAQDALISCGQFMVCPTNPDNTEPDCSKSPVLVSNSWGGGQNRPMYHAVIAAWKAAGIIPLFSNGNSGPICGTANSPADHPDVIGIGSTTSLDALSSFSSVGPSLNATIKPDISAPGSNVNSAYNTADDAYRLLSGTSMACPHAAGVVALLFAHADPTQELTFNEVKGFLNFGAEIKTLTQTGRDCGGVSEEQFPNNAFGFGRVNALRSVESLVKARRA